MFNNQPPQALQSLMGGGAPSQSPATAVSGGATQARQPGMTMSNLLWGLNPSDAYQMMKMEKDGQSEFLKSRGLWDDNAWWDGSVWVDPSQRKDPKKEEETDDGVKDSDPQWLKDVASVQDNSVAGLSDAMKKNIGFGSVTPGMNKTTGLVSSGFTKYMGDPVVTKPKPPVRRPDETGMRPNFPDAKPRQAQTAMQGTGMNAALAKLIGG